MGRGRGHPRAATTRSFSLRFSPRTQSRVHVSAAHITVRQLIIPVPVDHGVCRRSGRMVAPLIHHQLKLLKRGRVVLGCNARAARAVPAAHARVSFAAGGRGGWRASATRARTPKGRREARRSAVRHLRPPPPLLGEVHSAGPEGGGGRGGGGLADVRRIAIVTATVMTMVNDGADTQRGAKAARATARARTSYPRVRE